MTYRITRRSTRGHLCLALLLMLGECLVSADQPIMNMMPRWAGGRGVQVLYGTEFGDDLIDGSTKTSNPLGQEFTIDTLDVEGVYTFSKAVRITFKQPWVVHQSRVVERGGLAVRETGSGLDDLTLALPIKKYFNETGYTGNWSVNPAVKVPIGDDGDAYPVADGSWDVGLSFGWEAESVRWFAGAGIGAWWNGTGDSNVRELAAHLDLGWNVTDRFVIYWEMDPEWNEGRGAKPNHFAFQAGPAMYYRWTDTLHSRIEYKTPLYEDVDGVALTDGSEITVGLGGVW